MIRSIGSKKRSITKAIYDLKTSVKVLEHRAIGLEIIVEYMEMLDRERVVAIKGQQEAKKII